MASTPLRFSDQRYRNWVSGTLCLLYVKEGIEDIIKTEAEQFHSSLQTILTGKGTELQTCSSCTSKCIITDFRRKGWNMQCGLCNAWLQQIVQHHTNNPFRNLIRDNTDPKLWRTVPFEVFKAFMPHGCQGNQSAKDGDIQGILRLIQICRHFHTCGRIGRIDLIDELLKFRNSLFHSGNFMVEDAALQAAQKTMLDFLQGMTSLSTLEKKSVELAVNKITELQTGTLDMSLNKELEIRALQQKQNALDSELIRLKHDLATANEKASTTEDVLHSIQADLGTHTENIIELQAAQDSFKKFLQANNLEQDMGRLSTALKHHDQRLQSLATQTQHLDVATKQQEGEIATLNQRQQTANMELQERKRDSNAQEYQLQIVTTMLESHHGRLEHVEARLQNQTGSEASEMTDEAIKALRDSLIKHYRDNSLHVKIPVVDQELAIEDIYVVPEIKVLRETDEPQGVLSTVQNPESTGNMSICKQIFYTKDYKNKHIYTTADAGMGKTTFCKYIVNLWCEAHSKSRPDSHT